MVLIAKFGREAEGLRFHTIVVEPTDQTQRLLDCEVYFPSSVLSGAVAIRNGSFMSIGAIKAMIERNVVKEKGYVRVADAQLPIIIKCYYAAKGEAWTDISLYFLKLTAFVWDDPSKGQDFDWQGWCSGIDYS